MDAEMPDVFTKEKRSEVMSKIKGKGNKTTELALIELMRADHIIGWRRQRPILLKVVAGRSKSSSEMEKRVESIQHHQTNKKARVVPDFVFPKLHMAIFVDGCFWHGCPAHSSLPKTRPEFWAEKIAANKRRDKYVTFILKKQGWKVLRIWEHSLTHNNMPMLSRRLRKALSSLSHSNSDDQVQRNERS